ncbi:unnamed protein product [Adineta steineri]|uniref:Uncharacterized protein n=1 Tax=Adineta steineri TaxID=433720 RepID=A0A815GDR5_9BILA|nr:unnamed protein product [Adineta steineri]CAF4053734.1 unnamed protein product [Adineta steineri]
MTLVILDKLSCSALCKEILKIRQQFKNAFMKHIIEMNEIFQQISQQLNKAHKIKLSHTSIDTFNPAIGDIQTNNMNYSITHDSTNGDAIVCHHHHQYDVFKCEMDINHITELFIDCDRHKIHLRNESISLVHEINVSTIKCPLPSILYIGLYGADDQIRLQLA